MPEVSPPAAQSPGQQPQPQQAPFGASPITGPTPNKGYEAAGMQRVGLIVKQMSEILPLVGATSEVGQALMKAMTALAKHVPPGTNSNMQERNQIEKMALQNRQNGDMQQQLRQQMMQGQGQGGQQMPPKMAA